MKTHLVIVMERHTNKEIKSYIVKSDKGLYDVRREILAQVEQEIKYGSLRKIKDVDWCIDSVEIS